MMRTATISHDGITVVYGEDEVVRRTAHLFENATEIICAANTLQSWRWTNGPDASPAMPRTRRSDARIRKLYRSGMLLDPSISRQIEEVRQHPGVNVRISSTEVNETIILDGRLAILAGDMRSGPRSYSLVTRRETVHGIQSLFDATWRSAQNVEAFDVEAAEIRRLAPRVLDLLGQGAKDDAAARDLGLSVRTYRRRVAELMVALDADSRFQAGVRASELGLL